MSEPERGASHDPVELAERLHAVRGRLAEFRGRL